MSEALCLNDDPHPAHAWDSTRRVWQCPGRTITRAQRLAGYRDPLIDPPPPPSIDFAHLIRQIRWSRATFGPGPRTGGIIAHIKKELAEIEASPTDLTEWVDVVILALDGAWRCGDHPDGAQAILNAIHEKQDINEARDWPDWREKSQDEAIEHVEVAR